MNVRARLGYAVAALAVVGCGDVVVADFSVDETGAEGQVVAVAVGPDRRVVVSHDVGETWSIAAAAESPDANLGLNAVHYADGWFVAVGGGPDRIRIERSVDGETWELVLEGEGSSLHALTHTGARWVAVGKEGKIATSWNTADWTLSVVPIDGPGLWSVASDGQQVLVAVGDGDVVASEDGGESWTHRFNDGAVHRAVAFGQQFVVADASGSVHIANEERTDWAATTQPAGALDTVVWADGTYWATGADEVWTSPDASAWTSHPTPSAMRSLTWHDGVFLGVDDNGARLRSEDGTSWTLVVQDPAAPLHGIAAATMP